VQPDNEVWKPVVGYEGYYEVSNYGKVRNVKKGQSRRVNHVLALAKCPQGYLYVGIRKDGYETRKTYRVHRLVASAFIGECPVGYEVNHLNGVKDDNRVCNLQYVTPKENTRHSIIELGRQAPKGERHGRAKLNNDDVLTIRALALSGFPVRQMAETYGVAKNSIRKIIKRKTWTHLEDAA
jgi:hypothetical protein